VKNLNKIIKKGSSDVPIIILIQKFDIYLGVSSHPWCKVTDFNQQ